MMLLVGLLAACQSPSRQLIVYEGCEETEILYDLHWSVANIETTCVKHQLALTLRSDTNFCGYEIREGARRRVFTFVMTDFDLMLEIEEFFAE